MTETLRNADESSTAVIAASGVKYRSGFLDANLFGLAGRAQRREVSLFAIVLTTHMFMF